MKQVHNVLTMAGAALLLAACDGGGTSGGPGAVSEGEARALDDAAEMLEERALPEGTLPTVEVSPEEQAQAETGNGEEAE